MDNLGAKMGDHGCFSIQTGHFQNMERNSSRDKIGSATAEP